MGTATSQNPWATSCTTGIFLVTQSIGGHSFPYDFWVEILSFQNISQVEIFLCQLFETKPASSFGE